MRTLFLLARLFWAYYLCGFHRAKFRCLLLRSKIETTAGSERRQRERDRVENEARPIRAAMEAKRLDRSRNPHKYRYEFRNASGDPPEDPRN